jgi:prepilin-type N-terminal cleavage/methylation domain-containing protein
MRFYESRGKNGFTLIEVLVTVAILAIMTTALTMSVLSYIKSSNDKQRAADLKSLELALRLYKDANGRYPLAGCGAPAGTTMYTTRGGITEDSTNFVHCDDDEDYILGLVPDYLPKLPDDPNQEHENDKGFAYRVSADGQEYKVLVHASVETAPVPVDDPLARWKAPATGCTYSHAQRTYAIYSPGAKCW